MLKLVTNLVVRIADLVEAEGRTLRQVIIRLGIAAAVLVGVTVLALGGAGLIVAGAYMALSQAIGVAWAAVIMGIVCLGLAGGLVWLSRSTLK